MAKKAPRRTAQRILDTALDLSNRFGEPNVSATRVACERNIRLAKRYDHCPVKEKRGHRLCEISAAEPGAPLRNKYFENQFQHVFATEISTLRALVLALWRASPWKIDALACNAVILLACWLSPEYARAPRPALSSDCARGALRTLRLLASGLPPTQREHLLTLGDACAPRRHAEPAPAEES